MWRDVMATLLPLGLGTVFRGDTDPNWSSLWSFLKRIWFWIVCVQKADEAEFLQKAGWASFPNAFGASLLISPRSLGCLVCIRVQDAALSCTAAGTDAPWAHTRRVQSSLIFISGVVAYQFGGITCWENRDVTKLMYEVCCNGRPGKLTHLYVQRLALNAQRSLGHLPLAQKSKKPWAGLTGNGWDLGVEWDNSHVKISWFLRAESEAYTS